MNPAAQPRTPAPGSVFTPDFPEPLTADEARLRLAEQVDQAQLIEADLSARKPSGEISFEAFQEYRRWKSRAVFAKAVKVARSRLLKRWLAERGEKGPGSLRPPQWKRRAVDVLCDVYDFLETLGLVELTPEEMKLLEETRQITESYRADGPKGNCNANSETPPPEPAEPLG